jgi:hypothetical protein
VPPSRTSACEVDFDGRGSLSGLRLLPHGTWESGSRVPCFFLDFRSFAVDTPVPLRVRARGRQRARLDGTVQLSPGRVFVLPCLLELLSTLV